ncbi:MAG: alkaline phosphatase D family protein [Bacteroidota bacterium]
MKRFFLLCCLIYSIQSLGQNQYLAAGPMLGYNELREVMVWVQTTEAALVGMEYWDKGNPDVRFKSNLVRTEKHKGFTAHLLADQVLPGRSYEYSILINTDYIERPYPLEFTVQSDWLYHTPPPDFKIALGSCTYISDAPFDRNGDPYGGDYQIFESIADQDPDLMFWLGDNTYYRPADESTLTGMLYRNSHTRKTPEMQRLLATAHNYAIWDDHDYGPNDSDRSFIYKERAQEVFEYFWANPSYGLNGEGCTAQFKYNDVDVFMLDNRYFRTPNHEKEGEITILGKRQLEWFVEALINSKARYKLVMIGGQVVSNAPKWENYANQHAEEREYLLQRIEKENIKGVVFLTGDRHHTEMSMLTNGAGNTVLDLTISPLTSGASKGNGEEGNEHRVDGTYIGARNFGVLEFTGPAKERKMTITVYDSDGTKLWQKAVQPGDKKNLELLSD